MIWEGGEGGRLRAGSHLILQCSIQNVMSNATFARGALKKRWDGHLILAKGLAEFDSRFVTRSH